MAESLLFSIAESVLGKIASPALQDAVAIYSVQNQIRELRETLTAVKAVLSDAEAQKAKSNRLQVWLDRLQHVFYDAEDVLDELECEALRKQVISRYGGFKGKVHRFFSLSNPLMFRAKISHQIKEILERLSKISAEKDQFNLNVWSADNDIGHIQPREITYSFINNFDVVGRKEDKRKIIEMLVWPDDKNVSVIPIVGIGGLGKTTLAKLVFNDCTVKEQFELRLWVFVPEDFDLRKIIEDIIKYATGQSCNLDIEQSQTFLRDIIKDKKFLLVLDDVWSDNRSRWNELRGLLTGGASGSKIIVTTRSSEVASIMGTHPAHYLKGLSHDDSMALFKKWAFDEKEKQPRLDLLEIGKDIVKKSQGVPLLVKNLGSLLYLQDDDRHWTHIRDSETWELAEPKKDILPILKLSYDHLPPHLKRCFATLSLFPKGYAIDDDHLISLWMGLGLLSSIGGKRAMEDVSVEYVKQLQKRSLIQEVEESESMFRFRLHDLVHSLATIVAQNDCSIAALDTAEISERVRYVSIPNTSLWAISNYDGVPPFLRKPTSKRLRAIKFMFAVREGVKTREFVRTCISNCNYLRFLSLESGSFEELPSSICNLKQLRTLNLAVCRRLKKLPDTICDLQSLLHLSLEGCPELGELPRNMERLISLRYLYITTKQKSLHKNGIQYLENLQSLGLVGCKNVEILFVGTCRLSHLRRLEIRNCWRPISLPFGELISLESLVIDRCELTLTPEDRSNFPWNLRTLVISECQQVMELLQCLEGLACTLESFCVYDCPNLTDVPDWLPNHTNLRFIRLIRCPNLLSMPHGIRFLTALKELRIVECGELSRRCESQTGENWHKSLMLHESNLISYMYERRRIRGMDYSDFAMLLGSVQRFGGHSTILS